MKNIKAINMGGEHGMNVASFQRILLNLPDKRSLAVHVIKQNAALVVTRSDQSYIFEEFELSPRNEDVMATEGRLQRKFPGLAVAIDTATLQDSDCVGAITSTLSTMTRETTPGMQPQSAKAGGSHDEIRATTSPSAVSELFVGGYLRSFGTAVNPGEILKNTRDDVLWKDALAPWRRSPMWTLIRVTLQLITSRITGGSCHLYKSIMILIMRQILEQSLNSDFPSDLIYVMNAKIARRLHKLGQSTDLSNDPVTLSVNIILERSSKILSARWSQIQAQESQQSSVSPLASLNLKKDTRIPLPKLDKYLSKIMAREATLTPSTYAPESRLVKSDAFHLADLPLAASMQDTYAVANLQEFELWVAQYLNKWVASEGIRKPSSALANIFNRMKRYHELAQILYRGNPEGVSVMLLTLFALWVASDTVGTEACALLREYDPEIRSDILHSLLLPSRRQMESLQSIEAYLLTRALRAREKAALLFNLDAENGFPARFFDKSHQHQQLRNEIVTWAEENKNKKVQELASKKENQRQLKARAETLEHEFYQAVLDEDDSDPETEQRHSTNCEKCALEKRAQAIVIDIHEWPLPARSTTAKGVVFELRIPECFGHWRDTRLYLLVDILEATTVREHLRAEYPLRRDPHLSTAFQVFQPPEASRIQLLSENKPQVVTHYKAKPVTAHLFESDVCVRNGLLYRYFDVHHWVTIGNVQQTDNLPEKCTYGLPTRSFAMQKFLFWPASKPYSAASNVVLADQEQCPPQLALEEFKELGTLPFGLNLRWPNVFLEVSMPSIDWRKLETTLFVLQCIHQAGPPSTTVLRKAHAELSDAYFTTAILSKLHEALDRITENWEGATALATLTAIGRRVLSLSEQSDNMSFLAFLERARKIAYNWMEKLGERADSADDNDDRQMFLENKVRVALICASSFPLEVDDTQLRGILSAPDSVSTLITCSLVVQRATPNCLDSNTLTGLLVVRWRRLLHRSWAFLATNHEGLNAAIGASWAGYRPSPDGWTIVSNHWLATTSVTHLNSTIQQVHYNLLDGELLVDGLPQNQPPEAYRQHQLFKRLFGRSIVEVNTSNEFPGVALTVMRQFGDSTVYLGMAEDDLIVRAVNETNYEVVPCRFLAGKLPIHFVQEYIHWYDLKRGEIQFRPAAQPWNALSSGIWTLTKHAGSWGLTKDGDSLLPLTLPTHLALSNVLDPLAEPTQIHAVLRASVLLIDIPKLQHHFHLSEGSSLLSSTEHPGMIVDRNSSIGTLMGFKNKLVLKQRDGDRRTVLIPEAKNVSYYMSSGHITVSIAREAITKVHALDVDNVLGRLVDNGSPESKLYLAYLHALTSSCLSDPLTSKTGTEQALSVLSCAALRSFDLLSETALDRLQQIAQLVPDRTYYPRNLTSMQSVSWDHQLSFLSQHGKFRTVVEEILVRVQDALVFHPDAQLSIPTFSSSDRVLQRRDSIRSSSFRVSGFGAEDFTVEEDRFYVGRDRDQDSPRSVNAATMSVCVISGRSKTHWPAIPAEKLWKMLHPVVVHGSDMPFDVRKIRFEPELLKDWKKHIFPILPSLCRWLDSMEAHANRFSIAIWLATMAFSQGSEGADLDVIQAFALFSRLEIGSPLVPRNVAVFGPSLGTQYQDNVVRGLIKAEQVDFSQSPEINLLRRINETKKQFQTRRRDQHALQRDIAVNKLENHVSAQWPCKVPHRPSGNVEAAVRQYIRIDRAVASLQGRFGHWHNNGLLYQGLKRVQDALSGLPEEKITISALLEGSPSPPNIYAAYISRHDLFSGEPPRFSALQQYLHSTLTFETQVRRSADGENTPLGGLIRAMESAGRPSAFWSDYVGSLQASSKVQADLPCNPVAKRLPTESDLVSYLERCEEHARKAYTILRDHLAAGLSARAFQTVHHWPRVSPAFLLAQLARDNWQNLKLGWKRSIVQYALSLTALQRARRLTKAASQPEDLLNELRNIGHENWSPLEFPESLLIEAESGITIREVQETIAAEMRAPPQGRNATMQLNMGEGKSSVIVPMIACALADGSQLVRVVVGKPQSKQMAQTLIAKLGGLVNRPIHYMPFSRSLRLTKAQVVHIGTLLERCRKDGGVLLVQPEHLLSLRLMAMECSSDGRTDVGKALTKILDCFCRHGRDIVDESDDIFSPRSEVIYTMGKQRSTEFSPDRWIIHQRVLGLVDKIAPAIASELPQSIEVYQRSGSFQRVRLLRLDAEKELLERIAAHVCKNGMDDLPLTRQPADVRIAVQEWITIRTPSEGARETVEGSTLWQGSTKLVLLLLRGLLSDGLLAFVLGHKRWLVNYGLADRSPPTRLVVPYRGRDNPTPRSEFSHPDVVVLLTCLSYYYGGLSDEDIFTAFEHLIESDQADIEYQLWIQDASNLPTGFRSLQGVNLEDKLACSADLFPILHRSKALIDYWLSHLVFPKEMKEFPEKLSVSGWDLGACKNHPITGFSGTCDSRDLLPLDVTQLELEHQQHTNALVLEYILQPETSVKLMSRPAEDISDAVRILRVISSLKEKGPVQVILDVGAQILELSNQEVAEKWLEMSDDSSKEAVVFIDDHDEKCVVDKRGRKELLQTSSYSARLESCLVFLDESHTRGIDLKLPASYRAAVTLGPKLTKDRLVQACMRMRKLGRGQSCVFLVPEEIQNKVLGLKGGNTNATTITVQDILVWTMSETEAEIGQSMPQWAVQGRRFFSARKIWNDHCHRGNTSLSQETALKFLEPESHSIEERFRPLSDTRRRLTLNDSSDPYLQHIAERCDRFGDSDIDASNLQEEQERELSPEIEQERQKQKAPPASPATPALHPDVLKFATTGEIQHHSSAWMPAFRALKHIRKTQSFEVSQLEHSEGLLATVDFVRTIDTGGDPCPSGIFQRHVRWVLTGFSHNTARVNHMVVLSPYEADKLYPYMRSSTRTTLHLYKPRSNLAYNSLDSLDLHTVPRRSPPPEIPALLTAQLNLLAGQLFFTSRKHYLDICHFLGLSTTALSQDMSDAGAVVEADGFVRSPGKASPVPFIKAVISSVRRNNQDIAKTDMGRVLGGSLIEEVFDDETGERKE